MWEEAVNFAINDKNFVLLQSLFSNSRWVIKEDIVCRALFASAKAGEKSFVDDSVVRKRDVMLDFFLDMLKTKEIEQIFLLANNKRNNNVLEALRSYNNFAQRIIRESGINVSFRS